MSLPVVTSIQRKMCVSNKALYIIADDFKKLCNSRTWLNMKQFETQTTTPITITNDRGVEYSVVPTAHWGWHQRHFTYDLEGGDVEAFMAAIFPEDDVQNFFLTLTRDATNKQLFHATSGRRSPNRDAAERVNARGFPPPPMCSNF